MSEMERSAQDTHFLYRRSSRPGSQPEISSHSSKKLRDITFPSRSCAEGIARTLRRRGGKPAAEAGWTADVGMVKL